MQELFMKYPVGSTVKYNGSSYGVLGYEVHDGNRLLICGDGKDVYRVCAEYLEKDAVPYQCCGITRQGKDKETEDDKVAPAAKCSTG